MSKSRTPINDFDDSEFFDEEFNIDDFIDSMESPSLRKRRRLSGRSRLEQRLEEELLRQELADWDSYEES